MLSSDKVYLIRYYPESLILLPDIGIQIKSYGSGLRLSSAGFKTGIKH